MKQFKYLLVVFIIMSSIPMLTQAKEIKYNHNSITVSEIKKKVDFKVFTPKNIPDDWTLEIKTGPPETKENITQFSLHYMDNNDKYLLVDIFERKATPKLNQNKPNAVQINISGHTGYFEEWGNSGELLNGKPIKGGLLTWKQEGTFIKMTSVDLTKKQMIKIAESMK